MRKIFLAAIRSALIVFGLSASAHAFKIEAQGNFGDDDAKSTVSVIATSDLNAIRAVLQTYVDRHPDVQIRYVQSASNEIFRAIHEEGAEFDLVMSSAMDLQMRLANDGLAASIKPVTGALPTWARWRDQLFGVALEPVITLASRSALSDLPPPRTRRDLIAMLRENPERFNGRVTSYDPAISGVGQFLFAQDSLQSEGFWRLAEVLGRLNTKLHCCSGAMIDDLRAGRSVLAYNVVGSYAERYAPGDPDIIRISFEDYTLAILRSGLVPSNAPNPSGGTALLSYLLSPEAQENLAAHTGVALIPGTGPKPSPHLRPIRLDTGLLVYGDQLHRAGLLAEWNAAMTQP